MKWKDTVFYMALKLFIQIVPWMIITQLVVWLWAWGSCRLIDYLCHA